MAASGRLLLVGCGKMGGALLEAAIKSGPVFSGIHVVEPTAPPERLKKSPGITWSSTLDQIAPGFSPDLIVIAVKPQQMAEVLPGYARFKNSVFLSIAAGTTVVKLEKLLGDTGHAVVRAMPNLPSSIGKGISALVASRAVSVAQRALCEGFLRASGDVLWLEDESLMDAVTALSANGPAYVFALCEAMTKAGAALGIPQDMAMRLARQTIIGSGALLEQSQDSAEVLRRAVTSPGGTTEAALKILLAPGGLEELIKKTVAAGAERAKTLAQ